MTTQHSKRCTEAALQALQDEADQLKRQAYKLRHEAAVLLRRADGVETSIQVLVGERHRHPVASPERTLQQDFDEANEGLIGGGQFRI